MEKWIKDIDWDATNSKLYGSPDRAALSCEMIIHLSDSALHDRRNYNHIGHVEDEVIALHKRAEKLIVLMAAAPRLAEEVGRLRMALHAIANMVVNDRTNHEELSALCIFVAKEAIEGRES